MIRQRLGAWIDVAALPFKLGSDAPSPVILMFHSISDNPPSVIRSVPAPTHRLSVFHDFVQWLAPRARTVTIEQLVREIQAGTRNDAPTLALTFDDGYRDNYTIAYPILQRYGCTATVFVTTQLIGGSYSLTSDMIREMHAAGIGFGSHTVTHPALTQLSSDIVELELQQSKERLEDILQSECVSLSYPFGDHDHRIEALARNAGYHCALSAAVIHRLDELFRMPRAQLRDWSSSVNFAIALHGAQSWRRMLHLAEAT